MKKTNVIFLLIISFFLLISCPQPPIIPPIICTWPVRVGYFDTSNNPSPLVVDVVIVNETNETFSSGFGHYFCSIDSIGLESLELERVFYPELIDVVSIEAHQEIEKKNISLINKQIADKYFTHLALNPSSMECEKIFPGICTLSFFGNIRDNNFNSFNSEANKLFKKDVWDLTVKDFENVGGDFYYILDPAKSGTTSFGHVVSSDPDLNNKKMESGHVKIKLTIKDDPENEGKKLVEFAYLGEVTEEE